MQILIPLELPSSSVSARTGRWITKLTIPRHSLVYKVFSHAVLQAWPALPLGSGWKIKIEQDLGNMKNLRNKIKGCFKTIIFPICLNYELIYWNPKQLLIYYLYSANAWFEMNGNWQFHTPPLHRDRMKPSIYFKSGVCFFRTEITPGESWDKGNRNREGRVSLCITNRQNRFCNTKNSLGFGTPIPPAVPRI